MRYPKLQIRRTDKLIDKTYNTNPEQWNIGKTYSAAHFSSDGDNREILCDESGNSVFPLEGEPIFLESDDCVVIGKNGSQGPRRLPVFKAFPWSLIHRFTFVKDQKTVSIDGNSTVISRFRLENKNDPLNLGTDHIIHTNSADKSNFLNTFLNSLEKIKANRENDNLKDVNITYSKTPSTKQPNIDNAALKNALLIDSEVNTIAEVAQGSKTIASLGSIYNYVDSILTNSGLKKFFSAGGFYVPRYPAREDNKYYIVGVGSDISGKDSESPATYKDYPFRYCSDVYFKNGALYGAAWNDFAEYRVCTEQPGTVVCEKGDGSLEKSTSHLQLGASVVSDTFGMVIGNRDKTTRPIAVAGRVLVKYGGKLSDFKPGVAVCAGPDGKAYVMSRDEIHYYPDAILGFVSEIPTYKTWNGVSVNNRVWIKVH